MDKLLNDLVKEGLKALKERREMDKEVQALSDKKNREAWEDLFWEINQYVPPALRDYMDPLVDDYRKPYSEDVKTLPWIITFNVPELAPIRMRMIKIGNDWSPSKYSECFNSNWDTGDLMIGTPWIHREEGVAYWRYDLINYNAYFDLHELHLALGTAKERYDEYLELVRQAEYQAYELEYVPVEETQAPVDGFMTELKALIKTVAKDVVEG